MDTLVKAFGFRHSESVDERTPGRSLLVGAALIVVLTLLAYVPAMRGGFIWDDDAYVTANPLLTEPDGLQRIWFSQHSQSQYFPLVYTTLRAEHALWGLNPVGYHVVNVLLHCANALLVWMLLRRLSVPWAWLAAAIFAVHPVHVESVAWVTELKNTLSTTFYLLAVLAWLRFTDDSTAHRWRYYALALALYPWALFSKTTACTLPAALILVLWLQGKPVGWRRVVQVIPFVVFGVAMGLVSVWWERHLGAYRDEYALAFSLPERILIASHALWFYAGKLLWPTKLAFSYPRWELNASDLLQYGWLMACLGVGVVLLWCWRKGRRGPVVAVAFFVAALSPMLGFVSLFTFRYSFVADHYQYVASIGLIALFTAGLAKLCERPEVGALVRRAVPCFILLALGMLTWQQGHIYKDEETLWRDTIAKNPDGWLANNNLGVILGERGQASEAASHFAVALRALPDDPVTHNNLGNALADAGSLDQAIVHYREALRLKPELAEAHNNLANALSRKGRTAEAIEHYREAVRLKPDWTLPINSLERTLAQASKE